MSRPGKRHGFVCANGVGILRDYTRQRKKGYVCSNDTGVIVERDPDTVRGPDIMLFEDAKRLEEIDEKYGENPPLLSVEVLSPNETPGKVMGRVREQLDIGTKMDWVVDLEALNITVHQRGKEPLVLEETEELTGGDVFPDFRCGVAEFFRLPGE